MCVCAQSCQTLCGPMDCNLPGSSVCRILQARILQSGLSFPPPGHLPDSEIEPASLKSPALAGGFFISSAPGKASDVTNWAPLFLFATSGSQDVS